MKRALLAVSLACLAACAAPPPEEHESLVDLHCDGDDVSVPLAAIARLSGREIEVEQGVQDPIVLELHQVAWRTAIYEVARAGRCDVEELPNGSFAVSRPEGIQIHLQDVPLDNLLRIASYASGKGAVVASDVTQLVSIDTYDLGTKGDAARVVSWLVERHRLNVVQAGDLRVISRAPLVLDVGEGDKGETARFMAWKAPADGWFALVRRLTGRTVAHGPAPIFLDHVDACEDDVLRATVLASRVSRLKKPLLDLAPLTQLPSGKVLACSLEATVTKLEHPLALVDGRVVEEGSELVPGVRVESINEQSLSLREGDLPFELTRP